MIKNGKVLMEARIHIYGLAFGVGSGMAIGTTQVLAEKLVPCTEKGFRFCCLRISVHRINWNIDKHYMLYMGKKST